MQALLHSRSGTVVTAAWRAGLGLILGLAVWFVAMMMAGAGPVPGP